MTIAALQEANNLSSQILQVGQTLTIPDGTLVVEASSPVAPVVQQNSYTVQSGDSWARIAQRNGISVEALQQANAALDSLVLQPGQQLILPAGAGESASTTPTVTQSPAPVVPAVARTNVLGGEPSSTRIHSSINVAEPMASISKERVTLWVPASGIFVGVTDIPFIKLVIRAGPRVSS